MKKLKSIITVLIAFCLGAMMLSGCSNVTSKTPEKIISSAAEKLSKAKSISYDMDMAMTAGSGDTSSMDITTKMSVDMLLEPMQFQGDLSMDMGMLGNQTMKIYAETTDDQYSTYLSMDDGSSWMKQTMTKEEFAQFNNGESIKLYLTLLENITESGTETLNGIETTKFDCTISNKNLVKVLEDSGALSQFGMLGLDEENLKQFYTAMGDLPFTIWVDMENELPVRYQFDMGDALQRMMQSIQESDNSAALDTSISITNYTIDMTITGIDNIESIERPANLENSEEIMPEGE
jgi:outer membrane lipoprotein-sorting protein